MKLVLTLTVPTVADWREGVLIAASADEKLVRLVAQQIVQLHEAAIDDYADPFERELARLDLQDVLARLRWALGDGWHDG